MPPSPTFKLCTGASLPGIGFGTWQCEKEVTVKAVTKALECGYRHIDTAMIYSNEDAVGEAIKASGIPRQELFVTTKLWNKDHRPTDVIKACDKSLKLLGLEYVDLYLMHSPCALDPDSEVAKRIPVDITETWKAMESLVSAGKVKSLGVSNFSYDEITRIRNMAKEPIAVHQYERHPYLPQQKFTEWHKTLDIHISAYSPNGNTRPDFIEQNKELVPILKHPHVLALAEKYNATPSQIILSWQLAEGISVLPSSTNPDRIAQNFVYIPIHKEDLAEFTAKIPGRHRFCDFSIWNDNYPFHIGVEA